jgi:AAA15 family ATPase/GTPase
MLFIAQAVANSSEDLNQLREPLKWLQEGFFVVSGNMDGWASNSQHLLEKYSSFAGEISAFLQELDVPVTNIRVDKKESSTRTVLTHKTVLGEAEFDFHEESEGTKNLIGFWLPWDIHTSGFIEDRALVVDELDSSLHPEIVVSLVVKHIKSDAPNQLIFTTHDTHLMDAKLLRRDQFWLTERDANGATQLRSIHDFEGRESEDLEKRYYEGRYRGLPFVRRG